MPDDDTFVLLVVQANPCFAAVVEVVGRLVGLVCINRSRRSAVLARCIALCGGCMPDSVVNEVAEENDEAGRSRGRGRCNG